MNLENLKAARAAFAAVEFVDMSYYFRHGSPRHCAGEMDFAKARYPNKVSCDTSYCLAGTIQDAFAKGNERYLNPASFAEDFLNSRVDAFMMSAFPDSDEERRTLSDALFHDARQYGYDEEDDLVDVTKEDVLRELDRIIALLESEQ